MRLVKVTNKLANLRHDRLKGLNPVEFNSGQPVPARISRKCRSPFPLSSPARAYSCAADNEPPDTHHVNAALGCWSWRIREAAEECAKAPPPFGVHPRLMSLVAIDPCPPAGIG